MKRLNIKLGDYPTVPGIDECLFDSGDGPLEHLPNCGLPAAVRPKNVLAGLVRVTFWPLSPKLVVKTRHGLEESFPAPTQLTFGGSMNRRLIITSALSAAIAVPALLTAQKPVAAPSWKAEKCYGIAKAGKNDCASTGSNSCGGSSKISGDKKAWIYVPAGYCERIVGGSLTAAK
jgi:uncharacterized membrane protein